jgi:hypothetical protein
MKPNKFYLLLTGLVALALMTACTPAANVVAQDYGKPNNIRQLTASGTGEIFLTPDVAYVYIGVQSKLPNVAEALQDNNARAQSVSKALVALGVDAKDIQTSAFNVYPFQEYGPMGEPMESTYMVDNTVLVTIRDLQSLGKILDASVKAGANSINGVNFDVEEKAEFLSEARKLAIEKAKTNAEELAAAAGVELGLLNNLNVYSVGGPTPFYEGKYMGLGGGGGQVPVSAGQLILTVNADLTYEIK